MLLPLPAVEARHLSLKHHVALASLRAGRADVDAIATVMNVVYLAFFLRDANDRDVSPYRAAEAALNAIVERVRRAQAGEPNDDERAALERIVVQHDMQMATLPKYRLIDAWSRLTRIVQDVGPSPIPAPE
ncbi:hypothetical protein DIE06_20275 [Burkholderia sp. Bp8998]|nr:hypothetical protein DIE06_20275 [Burkholderia sp. Bp8998]